MAATDARQELVSTLRDPAPKYSQNNGPRKRYRRCKSAPSDFLHPTGSMQQPSNSISAKLHPSFMQVALFLGFYLGLGTLCFYLVRNHIRGTKTHGLVDSMYFCIVTMTTVGYGDLVPNSVPTKLLACAFVFTGMALVVLLLTKVADFLVEKQETLLVKALHIRRRVGKSQILKQKKTNKVKYKLLMTLAILLVFIVVGTVIVFTVENMDLVDAVYCVCCTITTLGYGDVSFSTNVGRIFAIFWIPTSSICLAQSLLYLAELTTERRQKLLVKWILRRRMTYIDIEAADLDNDGELSAAEYIIYKLKEIGKISQEDIALVMDEFEVLDIDQSGSLSTSDITLAQSSLADP